MPAATPDLRTPSEQAEAQPALHAYSRAQRYTQAGFHHLFRGLDIVELHRRPRSDAGLDEHRAGELVVARSSIEEHEPFLADLFDADRACAERVVRPGHEH